MTRAWLPLAFVLAFTTTGCGPKLRLEETTTIPIAGKVYEIDPIKKEQQVKILVEAPAAPVDVFAYTGKSQELAERNVFEKGNDGFLAHKRGEQSHDLTVTVPANEMVYVRIHRSGAGVKDPGEVKIKIRN